MSLCMMYICMACNNDTFSDPSMADRRCSSVPMSVAVVPSGNILELNVTTPENVPIGTVLTILPVSDFRLDDLHHNQECCFRKFTPTSHEFL